MPSIFSYQPWQKKGVNANVELLTGKYSRKIKCVRILIKIHPYNFLEDPNPLSTSTYKEKFVKKALRSLLDRVEDPTQAIQHNFAFETQLEKRVL